MAAGVTMRQMLEAGVHFGHQTRRWNPHMRPFIFTERNGIHILDLAQTVRRLDTALDKVREVVAGNQTVLFVGTKKQARSIVAAEAERCGMPYVNNRWLGGTLTNWQTMVQPYPGHAGARAADSARPRRWHSRSVSASASRSSSSACSGRSAACAT